MPTPDLLLVINPISGRGRSLRAAARLARELRARGATVETRFSDRPGHASELAADAATRGVPRIVACGGDGTVHEVVGGMAGSTAALGVLPCGRGNDFARHLGTPPSYAALATRLVDGPVGPMDLGRAGPRRFTTVTGVGFDAAAGRYVAQWRGPLPGTLTYLLGVLAALGRFRAPRLRLTGDFGTIERQCFLVATANATTYGGGMRIAPDARTDDGLLDVVIVNEVPRHVVLRLLPKVFSGRHIAHPAVEVVRTRTLCIEGPSPQFAVCDGELMEAAPLECEALPGALNVILMNGDRR